MVDHEEEAKEQAGVKVIVAAALSADVSRVEFKKAIVEAGNEVGMPLNTSLNWTSKSANAFG